MKTFNEYKNDLDESKYFTHSLKKVNSILNKWLTSYSLNYLIDINEDSLDFQLYIYNNFNKNKFDILITMCENMGYFPSTIKIDNRDLFKEYKDYFNFKNKNLNYKGNIDYIDYLKSITFENFNILFFQFESYQDFDLKPEDIPDIMYHVCRKIDIDYILKIGLIPKAKSKISFHPDRIYLTNNLNDAQFLIKKFKEIEDIKYSIIEVNAKELKNYLKLKMDPNAYNSFYTNQNISSFYLKNINFIV